MTLVLMILVVGLYAFNVYLFFSQVRHNPEMPLLTKVVWFLLLVVLPFAGIWLYHSSHSRLQWKDVLKD